MDCFNQFQFYIAQQKTFTTAANTLAVWSDSLTKGWIVNDANSTSDFTIQGFKNIDLYGVKLVANIQCPIAGGNKGIVDDYSFNISLVGQTPTVSGIFTTNDYAASTNVNEVRLTKYQNEIMFSDPIKSCTNISVNTFSAQGYVPNNTTDLTLNLILQVYFYYRYEGEELLF
jgi:hypothetical protein